MIRWLMQIFDQLPLISSPRLQNHIAKTQRAEPAHRNSLITDIWLGLCTADEQYEKGKLSFWLFPYLEIQIKNI